MNLQLTQELDMKTLIKTFSILALTMTFSMNTANASDLDTLLNDLSNEATSSIRADFNEVVAASKQTELNKLSSIAIKYQIKQLNQVEVLMASTVSLAAESVSLSEASLEISDDNSFSREISLYIAKDKLRAAIKNAQQILDLSNNLNF